MHNLRHPGSNSPGSGQVGSVSSITGASGISSSGNSDISPEKTAQNRLALSRMVCVCVCVCVCLYVCVCVCMWAVNFESKCQGLPIKRPSICQKHKQQQFMMIHRNFSQYRRHKTADPTKLQHLVTEHV